jgi:hypothetical protein
MGMDVSLGFGGELAMHFPPPISDFVRFPPSWCPRQSVSCPPFRAVFPNGLGLGAFLARIAAGFIKSNKTILKGSDTVAWSNGYDISFTTPEHVPRWF